MSLTWRGMAGLLAAVSFAAVPVWANIPGRPERSIMWKAKLPSAASQSPGTM